MGWSGIEAGLGAVVPRRALLAVLVATDLSLRRDEGPIRARVLARSYGMLERGLEEILKQMSAAGVIRSTRGRRGGYSLKLKADEVTVGALVELIGTLTKEEYNFQSSLLDEVISPEINKSTALVFEALKRLTIADLAASASSLGFPRPFHRQPQPKPSQEVAPEPPAVARAVTRAGRERSSSQASKRRASRKIRADSAGSERAHRKEQGRSLEIGLPNGTKVRMDASIDDGTLRKLLAALGLA